MNLKKILKKIIITIIIKKINQKWVIINKNYINKTEKLKIKKLEISLVTKYFY